MNTYRYSYFIIKLSSCIGDIKSLPRLKVLYKIKKLLKFEIKDLNLISNRNNVYKSTVYTIKYINIKIVKLLLGEHLTVRQKKDNLSFIYSSLMQYKHIKLIILSCQFDHLEIIKLLLKDKRVDPAYNDNELLIYVSSNGYLKVLK